MTTLKETILKFRANVVGLNPNKILVKHSNITLRFSRLILFFLLLSNKLFAQITSYGKANIPFFFMQWGGPNKKKAGRLLEGRTWDELPVLKKTA